MIRALGRLGLAAAIALVPACSDDDDAGPSFCERFLGADRAIARAFESAKGPEDVKAAIAAATDELDDVLRDDVPAQVRDDLEAVLEGMRQADSELAARGYDLAAFGDDGPPALTEERFVEAGERIDDYLVDECDVTPAVPDADP